MAGKKKKFTIPIEIVKLEDNSFHILVKAEIDGYNGDFIIDTGASVTVADSKLFPVPQIVNNLSTTKSGGVSGDIDEVKLIRINEFKIGEIVVNKEHIAIIDMDYINQMYMECIGREVCGLLGSDFCVTYNAIINYSNLTLTFKVI